MTSYAKERKTEDAPSMRPDPVQIIAEALVEWQSVTGRNFPPPCPPDPIACAMWWMEQQEPEAPGETYRTKEQGWFCGYAVRVRTTLLRFLSLPEADRRLVLAAREDGVFWRGETMDHLAQVLNEMAAMQKLGGDAYREKAVERAKTRLGVRIPEAGR